MEGVDPDAWPMMSLSVAYASDCIVPCRETIPRMWNCVVKRDKGVL